MEKDVGKELNYTVVVRPKRFNLSEFITTNSDEHAIATDAMIGLKSRWNDAYKAPAATGMPMML